jgi:hypothetical protein
LKFPDKREIRMRRRMMIEEKDILKNEEITKMSDFVPTTYKLFLDKLAKLRQRLKLSSHNNDFNLKSSQRPSEFNASKESDNNEKICSERISFRPPTRGLTADQITIKWLR